MKTFIIFLTFLFSTSLLAQNLSWSQLCKLDTRLESSSGLTSLNDGQTFWTHADNNSPAEIYEIDVNCNILKILKITGVPKRDWEEITADTNGNLFLGDFGNNNNNRKDLQIYILRNVEQLTTDSIIPEIIQFTYGDQSAFPPNAATRNFDMEAMIWYHDSLHLFSKNRTDPFTGLTYQYRLPDQAGSYTLFPIDSFKTGNGPMLFYWVTAAAIQPLAKELVLLSHDRMWFFDQFEGSQFFKGRVREIILPSYTQKEAVFAGSNAHWYFTDEYNNTIRLGGNLYKASLETSALTDSEAQDKEMQIWPNPLRNSLEILLPHFKNTEFEQLDILDIAGKCLIQITIDHAQMHIPLEGLSNGYYILRKTSGKLKKQIFRYFCKTE
ncbi:MAG: T9SS type A sorting domain-containing protein [Saprospiraceae bacterium]|nr:T9SS type A sorting domain-containing protein [Saprospiraceae bacterium]